MANLATILCCLQVLFVYQADAGSILSKNDLKDAILRRRIRQDHHHDDDEHSETASSERLLSVPCYLEHEIVEHFNELSSVFNIVDEGGQPCHYEDEHNSIHGNDTDVPENHGNQTENHGNHTSEHEHEEFCQSVYFLIRELLLDLNMTTPSCLENGTVKTLEEDPVAKVTAVDPGIAYGVGFVAVLIISVASLIGVLTVPFLGKKVMTYLSAFLVALGVSALACDAILHLIPHAFFSSGSGDHDHGNEEQEMETLIIWKGSALLAAIFLFFLIEGFMKRWQDHIKAKKDKKKEESLELENKQDDNREEYEYFNKHQGFCHGIAPVALIIIIGDAIHNFADGLAVGAAFTSGLGGGISTSLAVFFHELPHELGDYAILLSTGMKWYTAAFYNFLSAIPAIVGMFIGVAIGNHSVVANSWIFIIAAGIFLYVALVDMLPALYVTKNKRRTNHVHWFLQILGFLIGYAILLVLALFEHQLQNLIE